MRAAIIGTGGQDIYAVGSASAGVAFSVNRGGLFTLLEPSGCGKTTTTLVHVTHDRQGACAIADRTAVMMDGMIAQLDTLEALYRALGVPTSPGSSTPARSFRQERRTKNLHRDTPRRHGVEREPGIVPQRGQTVAAVLPRNRIKVRLATGSSDQVNAVRGTVERLVFSGSVFNVYVCVSEGLEVRAALTIEEVSGLGEESLRPESVVELRRRPEDIVFVEDS